MIKVIFSSNIVRNRRRKNNRSGQQSSAKRSKAGKGGKGELNSNRPKGREGEGREKGKKKLSSPKKSLVFFFVSIRTNFVRRGDCSLFFQKRMQEGRREGKKKRKTEIKGPNKGKVQTDD